MSEVEKITDVHRRRRAVVYVRQSSPGQVERNVESAALQYALAERAVELGWPPGSVAVVDDDTGRSGERSDGRSAFKELVAEVGLGHVGLILARETSRLARCSADWHRLLDLCALTGTLIADADGIYDCRPGATWRIRLTDETRARHRSESHEEHMSLRTVVCSAGSRPVHPKGSAETYRPRGRVPR